MHIMHVHAHNACMVTLRTLDSLSTPYTSNTPYYTLNTPCTLDRCTQQAGPVINFSGYTQYTLDTPY